MQEYEGELLLVFGENKTITKGGGEDHISREGCRGEAVSALSINKSNRGGENTKRKKIKGRVTGWEQQHPISHKERVCNGGARKDHEKKRNEKEKREYL